jgi:antitoxin ParD1/3/4
MTVANVSLPSDLALYVTQKLHDGSYKSSDELFAAAVQLLRDREGTLKTLKQSIQEGFEQLSRGEGVPFNADELKFAARRDRSARNHGAG